MNYANTVFMKRDKAMGSYCVTVVAMFTLSALYYIFKMLYLFVCSVCTGAFINSLNKTL